MALDLEKAGWNVIPVDQAQITAAINKKQELQYKPVWFAYNYVKVVEVDDKGKVINPNPEAGFYLVPVSDELVENGSFEKIANKLPEGWSTGERTHKG